MCEKYYTLSQDTKEGLPSWRPIGHLRNAEKYLTTPLWPPRSPTVSSTTRRSLSWRDLVIEKEKKTRLSKNK